MSHKLTGVSLTLDKSILETQDRENIEARCTALAREAMTLSGVPADVPLQRYVEVIDAKRERWDYFCAEEEITPEVKREEEVSGEA